MGIRINDENSISNLNSFQGVSKGKEQDAQSKELRRAEASADRVEISGRGQDIQRVKQIVESTPDVRADRVNELKEAIKSGSYQVSSEKIADSIITQSILDLLA